MQFRMLVGAKNGGPPMGFRNRGCSIELSYADRSKGEPMNRAFTGVVGVMAAMVLCLAGRSVAWI